MIDYNSKATDLQPFYSHFNVSKRLLFSGHSHQAWPDAALDGVKQSYYDAAKMVDYKWSTCFDQIEVLRTYLREYYSDKFGYYSYAHNTHDLLIKWISSLDLFEKPKIVSSSSEFHSAFRLFTGLKQVGLDYTQVEAYPLEGFADRFISKIDNKTAGIVISRVFFDSSLQCIELPEIVEYCSARQIPVLIDDYHGTNVLPLDLSSTLFKDVFLLVGGYKYLQWGEGNCFLRHPMNYERKPAISGWFASFSSLRNNRSSTLEFDGGDSLFMGATIEPASSYRAASVVSFFREHKLTPSFLSQNYHSQMRDLWNLISGLGYPKEVIDLKFRDYGISQRGGFLALQSPYAQQLCDWLRQQEIFTDARSNVLRVGPAPYNTRNQIEHFVEKLDEGIKKYST